MMGNLSQNVVGQGWVDLGFHTQYPISFISECAAFYRIFFGEEYRIAIREGQVGCTVRMMVGKSVFHDIQSERCEMVEIALRMSDAGNGMATQLAQLRDGGGLAGVKQVVEDISRQAHRVLTCRRATVVKYKLAQRFVCSLSLSLWERVGERETGLHVHHHGIYRLQAR